MFPESLTALQRTDRTGRSAWVTLHTPLGVIEAYTLADVIPALEEAIAAQARGLNAVGSIHYEASRAFDRHLVTHPSHSGEPLVRFILFKDMRDGLPPLENHPFELSNLKPSWDEDVFSKKVTQVREAIARGETYQVNLTYPWTAEVTGCMRSLFRQVRFAQSGKHQAYFEEEDRILLSASPERFFRLENGRMECRPMKGTARPGEESPLQESIKDRAENVMIVDMIRNDLGRVAESGSVQTPELFEIEAYPSLIQMTSTVTAKGPEDPLPWLKALFPCASITGAPKQKTMEWIQQLEDGPRGIYTGCMGGFFADGVTEFNVAIRTLHLDRSSGTATYSTGCGVVWDSDPASEYAESCLKTAVLTHKEPEMELFETMRFEPGTGILRREKHLNRLTRSASELGFEFDHQELETNLSNTCRELTVSSKVRMTLAVNGETTFRTTPAPIVQECLTFKLDTEPTRSTHPELRHKTTRRSVYENARARRPDVQETLLINEQGECMEFSIGNLLIEKDGHVFTPPVSSGLLPGTYRTKELEHGVIEKILTPEDLKTADHIYLTNAVRGRVSMEWAQDK